MKTYFMYMRGTNRDGYNSRMESLEGIEDISIKDWIESNLGFTVNQNQYIMISKQEAKRIWQECLNTHNNTINGLIRFDCDLSLEQKLTKIENLRLIVRRLVERMSGNRGICYYHQVN